MNRTLLDLVRAKVTPQITEKNTSGLKHSLLLCMFAPVSLRALCRRTSPLMCHMRVFGSQCLYVMPKKDVQKLDALEVVRR